MVPPFPRSVIHTVFPRWRRIAAILLLSLLACGTALLGQAGFEDDRVVLQGFYWESYRHGHPAQFPSYGDKHWYAIVQSVAPAIHDGRFNLIWMPPPSYSGEFSAGYNLKEYFRLDNSYGTFAEHRAALEALLGNGIEPVADIVINHRDGETGWAGFKNPDWGTWAICRTDTPIGVPGRSAARMRHFSMWLPGSPIPPRIRKATARKAPTTGRRARINIRISAISRIPILAYGRTSSATCCS